MKSTEYFAHQTLGQILVPYVGGFSKWYYTFIECINNFPDIDQRTQYMSAEPTLLPGCTWFGPVTVPKNLVGFTENSVQGKAGRSWKTKLLVSVAGSNMNVDVNLDNIIHHQLCAVGKLRSGGYWKLIGGKKYGLTVDVETDSGIGNKAFMNKLTLTMDSRFRGPVLETFSGDNSQPATLPPGISQTIYKPDSMDFDMNENASVNGGDTVINWTEEYISRFGLFPTIESWIKNGDGFEQANISILAQGDPPTAYIIRNGGAAGIVKIM